MAISKRRARGSTSKDAPVEEGKETNSIQSTKPRASNIAQPNARSARSNHELPMNFVRVAPMLEKTAQRSDSVDERRGELPAKKESKRELVEEKGQAGPLPRTQAAIDTTTMPAEVGARYVKDGRDYYFPSGDRAFVDHGEKITTRSENTVVIQDFSAIAKARQWTRVEVGGTESFKREAWRAAKLAGLEVRGYEPTPVELAQLVRALARQVASKAAIRSEGNADATKRTRHHRLGSSSRASPDRMLVGRLIDHGRDRYQFKPDGQMSYYIRVETPRGTQTRWGVDLERAVRKSLSGAQIGDVVGVRSVGKEPVQVIEKRRDSNGQVIGERLVEKHRNRWSVETHDFMQERQAMARVVRDQSIASEDAVRHHPTLKGTYTNIQLAEKVAGEIHPESRKEFLRRIRNELAASLERGEEVSSAVPLRRQDGERPQIHQKNEALAR